MNLDYNSPASILRWLDEMLTRNQSGALKPSSAVAKNTPMSPEQCGEIRQMGTQMIERGKWRGDISAIIRKMPGGDLLDDLYV